jgi:hypothetical protein
MRHATRILPSGLFAMIAFLGVLAPHANARVESEIAPPDKRKISVDRAVQVARQKKSAPLPVALSLPFAPPGFDLTDAEEAAAAAAAARLLNPGSGAGPAAPSDHELLAEIVAKVRPSGTFYIGDKPLLVFGKIFVKTGAHFTVTYKGNDYDLELTEIDGTNFTLRYKNDEITRPIQTGKSP